MTIQETIKSAVSLTNPSLHSKHWWTRDLIDMQKNKNSLSRKLYELRETCNHPVHQEYCSAANKYKEGHLHCHKYILGDPNNYSKTWIPSLQTEVDGEDILIDSNAQKAMLLV